MAVAVAMAMAMREVTLGAVLVMLAVVMEMASAAVPQATPALTTSLSLALKSWTNLLSLMNLKKSWHVLCLSVATPQSVNVFTPLSTCEPKGARGGHDRYKRHFLAPELGFMRVLRMWRAYSSPFRLPFRLLADFRR